MNGIVIKEYQCLNWFKLICNEKLARDLPVSVYILFQNNLNIYYLIMYS